MLDQAKIGAIVFYVKDISRTEKFYRDVLGLKTRLNPGHEGHGEAAETWMMADSGDVSLIFFKRDEKPGRSPIVVFTLDKGGIDDVIAQIAGKGVQIVTPVSEAPGGWSADILDPDGHWISFYQSEKSPRALKK